MMECIDDYGDGTCWGAVEHRLPLTATGRSHPRCARHWDEALARHEDIWRRYPDSPFAPADFDPVYAGERWDDDY